MLLSKIYTETERTSLSIALCGFVEKSMKTLFENGPKKGGQEHADSYNRWSSK